MLTHGGARGACRAKIDSVLGEIASSINRDSTNYRNLLLPIGGESMPFRQRARYIFAVYRADGLPDMSSVCVKNDFQNINPYVQISFAGMKVRQNFKKLRNF